MGVRTALPPDYDSWTFQRATITTRRDVTDAVRAALGAHGSLFAWAAAQPGRDEFQGRGATWGVTLGPVRAVIRHARRGGLVRTFSSDRFLNRTPRFRREIAMAGILRAAGIPTPAVLAGIAYRSLIGHTADVATERVDGVDLGAVFFGGDAPSGSERDAIWHAVGELVRRLHDAGFVHPDLQLKNILASPTHDARRTSVWLLDVDTVRRVRFHPAAAKVANIRRFFRSWAKHNAARGQQLTADDRAAFLAAYNPALAL